MQQQNTQKVEASKVPEYIKKAAKKAAEFNSNLNRERMEERRAYFDLQTHVGWLNFLAQMTIGSQLFIVKMSALVNFLFVLGNIVIYIVILVEEK